MQKITKRDWVKYFPFDAPRKDQEEFIDFALNAFMREGKRFVIGELPMGIGKSAVAVTIARYLAATDPPTELDDEGEPIVTRGAYVLTTQKILQEQYLADFQKFDMESIKSSSNYQCRFYTEQSCAESLRVLTKLESRIMGTPFFKQCKGACAYKEAKQVFLRAEMGCTNFSYFLAETMYGGALVPRQLLVMDECVRGDARILIERDTTVSMKELYENHEITLVISHNDVTKEYEKKKIVRRIRASYDRSTVWFRIKLRADERSTKLLVTGNHKIWTARGYIRADELKPDDVLKFDTCTKKDATRQMRTAPANKQAWARRNEVKHTCKLCNRVFESAGFKRHVDSLLGVRQCEVCDMSFEFTKVNFHQRFCSHTCYSASETTSASRSKHMSESNPMFDSTTIDKMRASVRKNWEAKSDDAKAEQITRFMLAPRHENRKEPNSLERFVIDLNLPSVEFTGLGSRWVTFKNGKRKNPDFVVTGTNKVIEVGDIYFWHTQDEIDRVVAQYNEIGIECLYLTNKQIAEDVESCKLALHKFVCNHDVTVEVIERLSVPKHFKGEHFKYNIEVEDNHNYFANSVLVSNCHNVEGEVAKFVAVKIDPTSDREVVKLPVPSFADQGAAFDWVRATYIPAALKIKDKLTKKIEKAIAKEDKPSRSTMRAMKDNESLDKHICKLNRFVDSYNPRDWVFNAGENTIEFKPVDISRHTDFHLFKHSPKILMLSATILDFDFYCDMLGIDKSQAAFRSFDSPFDAANRPIHYVPVGKMNAGEIDKTLPSLVEMVREIMKQHPRDKGVIHAHSYKIVNALRDGIKDKRLLFQTSGDVRDKILQEHALTDAPTVLVSPSMTEGVDLKDDLSRFQIFCKVPFPYLGDEYCKRKMSRTPDWYPYVTARTIIQASGRSIRNSSDWAVTYMLDGSFDWFYRQNKRFFPEYFKKSVHF